MGAGVQGRRIARDEQLKRARHYGELNGQAGERLTVNLGINRVGVERFADERISLPEVDVFFLAEIAHPESRQVAKIAETALRGERHNLKLVFEEVSLIGDFEGTAVIFCAANDDKSGFHLAVAGAHAKARKGVAQHFAGALPPVRENADAGFEAEVNGIDDHAVGAGARDGEEVTLALRLFERSGEAKSDFADFSVDEALGGAGDVPGKIKLLGEDVGSAARKECEWDTMSIGKISEAIDDF